MRLIVNLLSRIPEQGADKVGYLAFSSAVAGVTGNFFIGSKASQADAYALDVDNQDRLWNVSADLTGLAS